MAEPRAGVRPVVEVVRRIISARGHGTGRQVVEHRNEEEVPGSGLGARRPEEGAVRITRRVSGARQTTSCAHVMSRISSPEDGCLATVQPVC